MTARTVDLNGYIEIADNPISKVGVYPYLGSQIGITDPALAGRIFNVYRPAEELADPECLASFRLLPFVDEHAMLGAEDRGALPAERKGVHGMIGEQVRFDGTYLRGNLKIVSESLKSTINNGKIELSPGYRCKYRFTPGVYNGQNYDAVQYMIRGNHLALVDDGRTGPDVAVLDSMTFTVDAKELGPMADAIEGEDLKSLLAKLKPMLAEQANMTAALAELGIGAPAAAGPAVDEEPDAPAASAAPAATDEEPGMKEVAAAMDSMSKSLKALVGRIDKLEAGQSAMDSAIIGGIAARDALAKDLSNFVGTFDSSKMTAQQVAEYGVEKLGVPAVKGQEIQAVQTWLHGRDVPHKGKLINTQDGKTTAVDPLANWGKA